MKGFLTKYRHYGTSLSHPRWLNRNIVVANSISLATVAIVVTLTVVHSISHPRDNLYLASLITIASVLSVPFIHRTGNHQLARTILTIGLVGGTLVLTIARKMNTFDPVPMNTFYQSRAALTVFCVIPYAIFNFSERKHLILNLSICLICLLPLPIQL